MKVLLLILIWLLATGLILLFVKNGTGGEMGFPESRKKRRREK